MNSGKKFAGLTFEQAVHKYADAVTGVCVMRLQNYADAEDCFQNTFSKLYFKSPDFGAHEGVAYTRSYKRMFLLYAQKPPHARSRTVPRGRRPL